MEQANAFNLDGFTVGGHALFLIAGPCVIESEEHVLKMAEAIKAVTKKLGMPYIFKASYDKANRTSVRSFRGPGIVEGLRTLRKVKEQTGLPVLTDVHEAKDVPAVAEAVDVVQIPAFLCRQTDLLVQAGRHAKSVNIKKGQFVRLQQSGRRHAVARDHA
jgi:2-dehydro-3-deoxyphosphooctonate aldolase (KDO 8-P synthase)